MEKHIENAIDRNIENLVDEYYRSQAKEIKTVKRMIKKGNYCYLGKISFHQSGLNNLAKYLNQAHRHGYYQADNREYKFENGIFTIIDNDLKMLNVNPAIYLNESYGENLIEKYI